MNPPRWTTPPRRPRPSAPHAARARSLLRALAGAGWVTALGAAAFGLHRLEPLAERVVAQRRPQIVWENLPGWLATPTQADFLAQREGDAGLSPTDLITDATLARRIGESLRRSPWLSDVRSVRIGPDGAVRIDAEFRVPLALVERDGMTYLVDQAGVLLRADRPAADVDHSAWFVIHGVRAARPPAPGEPWPGDDLRAGLKLADYLLRADAAGRLPCRPVIRAIDVSNVGRRLSRTAGELRLRTSAPESVVHWGLPPGEEYQIEAPTSRKLAWLNQLHETGLLRSGREIDLRDPDRVLRSTQR